MQCIAKLYIAVQSRANLCKSGTLSCVSIFAGQREHWDGDDDDHDPAGDDGAWGIHKIVELLNDYLLINDDEEDVDEDDDDDDDDEGETEEEAA